MGGIHFTTVALSLDEKYAYLIYRDRTEKILMSLDSRSGKGLLHVRLWY